jgi:hypothetical protein
MLGVGDSYLIKDFLSKDEWDPDLVFLTLKTEVNWQEMSHKGGMVPRLIALQGKVKVDTERSLPIDEGAADDNSYGDIPLYRLLFLFQLWNTFYN